MRAYCYVPWLPDTLSQQRLYFERILIRSKYNFCWFIRSLLISSHMNWRAVTRTLCCPIQFSSVLLMWDVIRWDTRSRVRWRPIIVTTHGLNRTNRVQGRYLLRGSRLVDFDIRLGVAECVPLAPLTDNQVDCRPPTNKPKKDVSDTFCHRDTLSTKVCVHCSIRLKQSTFCFLRALKMPNWKLWIANQFSILCYHWCR